MTSQINQQIFWKPQEGQEIAFRIPLEVKEILLHGNRGSGKRIHDENQVLTKRGWIKVGEVTYQDQLVAPDGSYVNILNISKRLTGPLYKFTFDDSATVVVDEEHNWSVAKITDHWQVKTTQQLIDEGGAWFIPLAKAPVGVEYTGVDPYRHRIITSITRVDDGPGTCFEVDHLSHQFICQDFIVTHNSDCLLVSFLRGVGRGWGSSWRGLCLKRTVPEIGPLFEKAKSIYLANCPGIKYTQHPYAKFVWPGGEMLTLRHMLDPDDYNDVHGSEFQWIGWEELTTHATPEVYLRCMSLLRSSHPEASKWMQVWSTTNPGGPGHSWCRRRWQLPAMNNKIIYDSSDRDEMSRWSEDPLVNVQARPRVAVFLDVRRNLVFLKSNPTYLADLVSQAPNEATRRAWIDGDWDVVAGGLIDDVWSHKYHVVKPFPIPKTWRIDRSFDWGSSTPFCCLWWAESDGCDYVDAEGKWRSSVRGDLFCIAEWYGTNGQINQGLKLTAEEVARGILERQIEWMIHARVKPGPADNQITAEMQSGKSIASDMAKSIRLENGVEYPGITWTTSDKAAGARITGWNMLRDRLKRCIPDQDRPMVRELPGLFFFSSLEHTLHHLPTTPRDEKETDDVPKRGEYHIQDTIRYRILADGRDAYSGPTVGGH